jgi:hypothetical protein
MAKKNPHIGSSFDSWLDEKGIRREVTAAAVKAVKAAKSEKKLVFIGATHIDGISKPTI